MQQSTYIMRKIIIRLALLITIFNCHFLYSQNSKINTIQQNSNGEPGAFLRMGVGARAFGLGGAYSAIADDPAAVFWNPAGLSQITNIQMELMNVDLPFDRSFNFASGIFPVKNILTFGLSWVGLRVNDIEGRSSNTEQPEYFFGQSQNAFFLSFSRFIGSNLAVGGNLKYIQNHLDTDVATGLGMDASVLLQISEKFSVGFLAQDIGTDYRWQNGVTEGVPMTFRLGTAFKVFDGMLIAADVNKTSSLAPTLHFGMEFRPVNVLPLRVGYHDDQVSGGAGFNLHLSRHVLEINYGYANDKILNDDMHRVSLIFSFGVKSKPTHDKDRKNYNIPATRKKSPSSFKTQKVIVATSVLNVRSGPGAKHMVIAKIRQGESYKYISTDSDWIEIKLHNGTYGWVHSKYIKID